MTGIFRSFKGSAAMAPGQSPSMLKKADTPPESTPLEKMLQNAGPIRLDGSDKFFGMENALYYSIPFRENVIRYPPLTPPDTPDGKPTSPNIRVMNGAASSPSSPKGLSASEALKRRASVNAGQIINGPPTNRPEDRPDAPEYKKKHAMLKGPILDLTYENARTYGMEESTFTALKDIFMTLISTQASRTGVLSPQRFLEIFKRDNEMFRTSMHQDAHEFYGLVLNAVISNVEDSAKYMREFTQQNDDGLVQSMVSAFSNAASSMGLASGTRSPGTGWVHEIFEGVLTSETKCLTCENASQRDETFLDLSIDLEQHSSVTSCLRKFSAEEMLCERNKFHCDNCGGLQEAEKRMKIKRLPKILTLHLKRFKYTEDMTRLQKLFHRVVYPYHLRMFNTTDDAEDPDRLYELYAVVVHIGGNAYHGHYVSIIKTKDRGWLLFDDEMVEPVDKHYVRNFFGDKPGMACAYVLFYQETTLEAVQREQEAEGLAEAARSTQEAGIALGHPQPNGTHPSSESKAVDILPTPSTPANEKAAFASLNHAKTEPMSLPSPGQPLAASMTSPTPPIQIPDARRIDLKTKEDREREKRAGKEAEKARKIAEKEKAKEDERRRKETEGRWKENRKTQAEQLRATMAASRISAAEEEAKRQREATTSASLPTVQEAHQDQGLARGHTLGRGNKRSKSLSRKSFSALFGKHEANKDVDLDRVVDEEAGPQTPDRNDKTGKERFSFSLHRKKSKLFSL
ncbi:MAG: hypothetical protein M1818_001403 [Claussenomyces sp. TS43310]|nr:MAG: hypothetical protein M1818_001403 [Claussenomyces sp. TS43310]